MNNPVFYDKVVILTKDGGLSLTTTTFENATLELSGNYLIVGENSGDSIVHKIIELSRVDAYKVYNNENKY
jgi:hypothetical protein